MFYVYLDCKYCLSFSYICFHSNLIISKNPMKKFPAFALRQSTQQVEIVVLKCWVLIYLKNEPISLVFPFDHAHIQLVLMFYMCIVFALTPSNQTYIHIENQSLWLFNFSQSSFVRNPTDAIREGFYCLPISLYRDKILNDIKNLSCVG